MPKGIMVVESAPAEGHEDDYNKWYSGTHIPQILEIPGFVAARRFRVNGSPTGVDDKPGYLAIYELEADDLNTPIVEMRARSADGRIDRRGAVRQSPPPVVTVYELLD
ncbi:MAG: hypothetical protein J2P57_01935 [Acidimicrobiaceae bacterium]|nr:hypothetical protein [Acidimicrobiaceae bacterium]